MANQHHRISSASNPTGVVFIGHSFAKRFESYCASHGMKNGGLDLDSVSLSVVGKSGVLLSFVYDSVSHISRLGCTKAIIQIGGNDLNSINCQPEQLAREILNVARQFVNSEGFDKVALCQLFHRFPPACSRKSRYPLRPGYNKLVDIVNAELWRLVAFFPKIHFWKHRGMLLDYQSLVSRDGCHVGPGGQRLYFRSVRGAALFLSKQ